MKKVKRKLLVFAVDFLHILCFLINDSGTNKLIDVMPSLFWHPWHTWGHLNIYLLSYFFIKIIYRTRATITRSWLETALEY